MDMEKFPFRYEVTARYSDSFDGRAVRAPALMACMEEAAAEHCRSIGRDVFSMLEEGQGWILTGGGLRMFSYPSYGERFFVDTWMSEWRLCTGIREYRILSQEGETLGEGGGRWVFWDMESRRPSPVPEAFKERWHRNPDSPYRRMYPDSATPSFPTADRDGEKGDASRFGGDPAPAGRIDLKVRRGDVDLYDHLHNTTYMDWLMEAVPDGLYRDSEPERMGIRFFGEARLGDEVSFISRKSGKGWMHDVVRDSDGSLLVRGYTEWRERGRALTA